MESKHLEIASKKHSLWYHIIINILKPIAFHTMETSFYHSCNKTFYKKTYDSN